MEILRAFNFKNKSYGTFDDPDQNKRLHESEDNPEYNDDSEIMGEINQSTIIVKNSGSMARDQFAIERTFLSFLKIALSLFVTGATFLIRFNIHKDNNSSNDGSDNSSNSTQTSDSELLFSLSISFFPPDEMNHNIIGIIFMILGLYVMTWATHNYLKFQRMLIEKAVFVQNDEFNFYVVIIIGSSIIVAIMFLESNDVQLLP